MSTFMQVLLQHQLAALPASATAPAAVAMVANAVSQCLWALAHMGPPPLPPQQQQQQQQAVTDTLLSPLPPLPSIQQQQQEEVLGGNLGLNTEVRDLAGNLLLQLLQMYRSAPQDSTSSSSSSSGGSSSSSDGGCCGSSDEVTVSALNVDAWISPDTATVTAHAPQPWQSSMAAWAAAMCDLTMCKDTVLELCSILARPAMWGALRHGEYVQLLYVHLWLTEGHQWSNVGGLAGVLNLQQLEALRRAKQMQTQKMCGVGVAPTAVWQQDQQQGRHVHRAQEREPPPTDPLGSVAGDSRV
jgi:hypothetical protein